MVEPEVPAGSRGGKKIAHISDTHFGRIAHEHILDALLEDVESAGVDLVAVSGDLTQRAFHTQYREAAAFFKSFSAMKIIVPGNHDVFPWWYPFSRIFRPLARFQTYFGKPLIRVFEAPGLAFLGVNSSHGLTVKGGKIAPEVDRAIWEYFYEQQPGTFKILMVHHHLIYLEALMPHDISKAGPQIFQNLVETGVDLVLCGHLHISHVESPRSKMEKTPVIASAGTATSDRGRRSNENRNFYNLIEIMPEYFTIEERTFLPETVEFKVETCYQFERR